jgi:ribosomal protein S6
MEYEINYLILQSSTSDLTKLRQEMEDLIKSCGCEVLEKKEYLKRKLAYEINREGYGFHTVLRFKFPEGEVDIEGLKKKLNLNFKVARYLIIRPDGLSSLKDLDKKREEEKKEETLREEKTVVKQEEVEKIVARENKREGADAGTSKIKTEKKKDEIKREDIGKIKEVEETKESKEEPVKENKEEEISVDILSDDSTVEKSKKKSEDEDKEDEAKDKKGKGKKASKGKDKVSLDDLDEKLDEILNI